jgi:predicted O-methyltransferase YrrM
MTAGTNSIKIPVFKVILALACILILVFSISNFQLTQPIAVIGQQRGDPAYVDSKYVLKDRSKLSVLLNRFAFKTMIEIGVQRGGNADQLLQRWPGFKHYYGIDAWQQQTNYLEAANVNDNEQTQIYQTALNTLVGKYGKERITLIRNFSTQAVSLFKPKSIDFIYVDARHDYCGCAEDLNSYYPILRCGGLFAGHDYVYRTPTSGEDWGVCANGTRVEGSVKQAVLDFANQQKVRVQSTGEPHFPSWFFFKDCDEKL